MCKKLVCLVSVVLVLGLAGSALAAHPNLVAWWPFDSNYDNAQGDSGLDGSANGGGVSITTTGGEYIRGGGGLKIDDDTASTNYVDVLLGGVLELDATTPVAGDTMDIYICGQYSETATDMTGAIDAL
ncbi:hypothetical protein LCGC14_2283920, partial [marine sediment metagenome]